MQLNIVTAQPDWSLILYTEHSWCESVYIHSVSKNVPPSTCYNLDIHDPITVIFSRNVTEKVRNHKCSVFPPHLSSASALPCEIGNPEDSALGVLYMQHSPTSAALTALLTSFLVNYAPNSPYGRKHWLQDLGVIQQHEYESWVKKIEDIKQLVEFGQCINTAFEGKMQLLRLPVLPGSAEAQVIWCGTVKCLLIAHFIGNMSAKKYQNPLTRVKVIAS